VNSDLKSLSFTLSGVLFGFSVSMLLWVLCTALDVNPLVPERVSDVVVVAGLILLARRFVRVMKR
jgi:hypothetical protein